MRCIIHEVRRNSNSIATNFEENTAYFSQLEIIRLIQSIPGQLIMSEQAALKFSVLFNACICRQHAEPCEPTNLVCFAMI